MRKIVATALITLSVLGLSACSSWTGTGTVTSKHVDAASTIIIPGHSQKVGNVTTFTPAQTITDDEDFVLVVTDEAGEKHDVEVAESVYNDTAIGSSFTITE